MPEELPDEQGNLEKPPAFFPYDDAETMGARPGDHGPPISVTVEGVYVAQQGTEVHHFVILTDGDRRMPIIMGEPETHAIALPLEKKKAGRPKTHDLLAALLERLDAKVDRIFIDDLWGSTYYAKIFLQHQGEEIVVDSRPSDAIALAVRVEAPIYVADQILEQASQ
jgi:uncharacterized protein